MEQIYFGLTRNNIIIVIFLLIKFWGVFKLASTAKLNIDFTNSRFGPYYLATRSVEKCNLPGPVDTENECSNSLSVYKISRMKEEFRGELFIPRDLPRFSAMISADLWKDGGFKPFYKKEFDNACEQGIAGVLIKKFFNVGKSCLIKKGNYSLRGFEPYKMVKGLIGENFFYERISVVISWSTKKGLINCVKFSCDSKPMLKNRRSP